MLIVLISFLLTAWLGSWLAPKAGLPKWVGVIVGGFGHMLGCAVLACIWLVKDATAPPPATKG